MWKPVVGYESLYEVSDKGNVRSKHSYGRGKKGGLLKPWRSPQGYSMATLSRDGATFVATTSRLVLAAFVGPHPPDKPYACHKNGNTKDNRLANLYWGSNADNQRDRDLHGTSNKGSANGHAVLQESDVVSIKRMLRCGRWSQKTIASWYGVDPSAISAIKIGRSWAHVA